jgi:murein DD-endopeptidase MepM/ murein hydrolase activator NlpD
MPFPVALRASFRPSVIMLALVAVSAAGCSSDTSRFESPFSNPFAAKPQPPAGDMTASVNSAPSGRIESAPLAAPGQVNGALPPPTRPATMAGSGAGMTSGQDFTGSVKTPQQARWDWNGGTAVTVVQGDTLDGLSRRHGVPASAIMQANALTSPAGIRPGQRLVIPRYSYAGSAPTRGQSEHVVSPGETMTGIAQRYSVPLKHLAKANRIEPYAQLKMGDRLVIPGRFAEAKPAAVAPKSAQTQQAQAQPPKAAPAQAPAPAPKMVAAAPAPTALAVTTSGNVSNEDVKGSGSGAPAFRWPVRGRIIAGFGPKPNGQQNDGINLSVPEGTPIKAAEDGVVAYAGNELKGYGNLVLIRHPNGFVTAYAHASELMVKRGDTIKRGQTIAKAGQTGTVTSPQVHFEIRKGSSPVDPTQYLNGA